MHLQINVYVHTHKDAQMVFMPEKKRAWAIKKQVYMSTTILRLDKVRFSCSRESAELIGYISSNLTFKMIKYIIGWSMTTT